MLELYTALNTAGSATADPNGETILGESSTRKRIGPTGLSHGRVVVIQINGDLMMVNGD